MLFRNNGTIDPLWVFLILMMFILMRIKIYVPQWNSEKTYPVKLIKV
jgi:hypothetical protein